MARLRAFRVATLIRTLPVTVGRFMIVLCRMGVPLSLLMPQAMLAI